jgi:energy-coupling factor transport system permease protein
MTLYLYVDRDTWVHRLHPVVRLLGMLALFVSSFLVQRPGWHVVPTTLVVLLLWWTGGMGGVRRMRVLFVMVFLVTLLVWTLFYGPDGHAPLVQAGPLLISRSAPWFALGMAIKLATMLGTGVLFLTTTRVEEFAQALTSLGIPYKLGFTLTLSFRLVPVFLDAAATVVQAQRCRGLDFNRGSLWRRLLRYVPVIVPVFMGALRRADNMAMALETRGFQSRRPRTVMQQQRFDAADAAALAVLSVVTGGYLVLWWRGVLVFAG